MFFFELAHSTKLVCQSVRFEKHVSCEDIDLLIVEFEAYILKNVAKKLHKVKVVIQCSVLRFRYH